MKKVYKVNDGSFDFDYVILDSDDFEECNVCESFDDYGQKINCYNAECYSLDNSGSSFYSDMCKELNLESGDLGYPCDLEELLGWFPESENDIRKFIKEETIHREHIAKIYWDGSNHRTVVLENDSMITDISEIDEDKEKKILSEFNEFDTYIYNGVKKEEIIGDYTFMTSKYSNDYALAWVSDSLPF